MCVNRVHGAQKFADEEFLSETRLDARALIRKSIESEKDWIINRALDSSLTWPTIVEYKWS